MTSADGGDSGAADAADGGLDANSGGDAGSGSGTSSPVCPGTVCAAAFGQSDAAAAFGVAVDSHDNVYVVGFAVSSISFAGHVFAPIGPADIVLASFASDGSYRWAKRIGFEEASTYGYAVAVDASDNVYIAGLAPVADFGSGYVTGPGDSFIASYTSDGTYRWAEVDGGEAASAIATSGTQVFATGVFGGTAQFGSAISLTSQGGYDVFVAAHDSATGAPIWANDVGTAGDELAGGIVAHDTWIAVTLGIDNGLALAELASYTTSGSARFTTPPFSSTDGCKLSSDAAGNLYVTGRHDGGSDVLPGALTNSGDNVMVRAYDGSGSSLWSWTLVDNPPSTETSIPQTPSAIDPSGHVVLAGDYTNAIFAGGSALVEEALPHVDNLFFASFDDRGDPTGAIAPFEAWMFPEGTAIDSAGRRWVGGWYLGAPNFGDGSLPASSETGGFLLLRYVP